METQRTQTANTVVVPGVLLGLAGLGWWLSARMVHDMSPGTAVGPSMGRMTMSFAPFMVGWLSMMAAMMFPAIFPVTAIYRRAAGRGQVAPTPFFVTGYLFVWSAIGVPGFFLWRALSGPVSQGGPAAARFAAGAFLLAAVYQVSPLKSVCLRHCRSPLSFFLRQRGDLRRRVGAARAGATHGLICLGCCWALMAILIALGTMQLAWMLALAVLIFIEKVTPIGELVSRLAAGVWLVLGVLLLIHPAIIGQLT